MNTVFTRTYHVDNTIPDVLGQRQNMQTLPTLFATDHCVQTDQYVYFTLCLTEENLAIEYL